MSFVAELKQRKVFRVAMVYLVVAWVAIQAASIALPAFDAPAWTLRVLILLFALGLPLALLLAWVLELTPQGPKLTAGKVGNRRMAWLSIGLAALALAWFFYGQPALRSRDVVRAQDRSIAVLPFVNMSGDPANDYFSDGLAETTLDMLAQVQNLKVIARTSSFAFKGKDIDMREIGKALGAAHLLEGSVQQAGDTVRVTVQLIRAADGSHLWSRHFDRRMSDVFNIQDEVATAVVDALQVALPKPEQQRLLQKRTDNVAAYQEYLKGNALLPGRKVADMRAALAHFERAIELDPGYARAWAAASSTLGLLETYATITPAQAADRRRDADRALELAPSLGEAYIARATILQEARDLARADRDYQRGIEFAPGFATAYQWYGEFLLYEYGEIERSLPMFKRALVLDPLSPVIRNEHANALGVAGRVDEALEENRRLLAEHPDFSPGYGVRAGILESRGDLVGTLRAWQAQATRDPEAVRRKLNRCYSLGRFGAVREAATCAADFASRFPDKDETLQARSWQLAQAGDFSGALAVYMRSAQPNPWDQVRLLVLNKRGDEALPILRRLAPEMFEQPTARIASAFPSDAVLAGAALLQAGATAQGRDLLQRALRANASHAYDQPLFGRGWWDVYADALLDDMPQACNALHAAVASGYFLDLAQIDVDPMLANLRVQPCYQRELAPARVRAAAQVDAARAAGLL